MRALGCLVVILLLAIGGYVTRDYWLPHVPGFGRRDVVADTSTWQQLTPAGAQRARTALQRLQSPRGPVFLTVTPGDLASYIIQELSNTLPASTDSIEAAAIGDRLHVRALVRTSELGDRRTLGPLAALLGEQERLQLGGTFRIVRPGLAELQVKELRIRDFPLPSALIPRLVRQLVRGERPAGLSPDGIPLRTPAYIGDVRVSNGQITLYRTTTTPAARP